ncbi:MAG: phage tail tape measure protein [Gammaproteobacteria bacterium TMED78]|nr:MAG: phage tail tape measure protein [Gammaproteobacteria bacterium TMED78]
MATRKPNLKIKIGLDDKPAVRQLKEFRREFKRSAANINASLELVQKGTRLIGSALSGLTSQLRAVTQVSRDYEKATMEVATIADKASFPMAKIRDITLELGATYGSDVTENAKSLYQTISAGVTNAADAQKILSVSSELAIGGLTTTTVAVDALTNVSNAYGKEAVQAFGGVRGIADSMSLAVVHGKTTIEELASSLGAIAPTAAAVGVPLDDLLSAIAAITSQGISTTEAITSLNGIFGALQKQTSKTREEAERLGIDFNVAALRAKGLGGLLQEVRDNAGLTDESFLKLTGRTEALKGALALTTEGGRKNVEVLEAMANKAGTSDRAFEMMSRTFGAQMEKLSSLTKTAKIELGDYLIKNEDFKKLLGDIEDGLKDIIKELRDEGPAIRETVSSLVQGIRDIASIVKNNKAEILLLTKLFIAAKLAAGASVVAGGVKGLAGSVLKGGALYKAGQLVASNPALLAGAAGTGAIVAGLGAAGGTLSEKQARAAIGDLPAPRPGQMGYRKPADLDAILKKNPQAFRMIVIGGDEHEFEPMTITGTKKKKKKKKEKSARQKEIERLVAEQIEAEQKARKDAADRSIALDSLALVAEREKIDQVNELIRLEMDARKKGNEELADLYGQKAFIVDAGLIESQDKLNKEIEQQERHHEAIQQMGQRITSMVASGISSTIGATVKALATGADGIDVMLKKMLGGIISNIGTMLIQMGTSALVLQLFSVIPALAPFAGPPGMSATAGAVALATGAGLVALGSSMGGTSSAKSSRGSRASASSRGSVNGGARNYGGSRIPGSDAPRGFVSAANSGPVVNNINVTFGRGVVMGTATEVARKISDISNDRNRLRLGMAGA